MSSNQIKEGAMDYRKDLNISGNRVVNVADPREDDHVATKHYVDHLHLYRPDSNAEEYIRYINARYVTLHSLAGLCKLETTFGWVTDPKRGVVRGMVGPYMVLESSTGHCLFIIQEQDLAGKSMTLEYTFPVQVQKWDFCVLFEAFDDPDEFLYVWEASNDKENWEQRGQPKGAKFVVNNWNGCDGILSFINNSIGRYRYWRLLIQHGKVTKTPNFDIMLM